MNQSESIAKLSEALAKAQGVMEGASKYSNNPFFHSKYADLASVWDACRKPLADNGLSVVQTADFIPEHPDMVCIETILCHASGEWIKGRLAVKPVKSDPQGVGSCITYLRRYSLQSIVGIAPEDDDGNAASGKPTKQKTTAVEDVPDFPPTTPDRYPDPITLEQQTTLNGIIIDKGVDQEKFLKFMGVSTLSEILAKDYKKAIESLKLAKGNKAA